MASAENRWLVRGDLVTEKVTALRKDAECPSQSPDGTEVAYNKRIGYKKRIGAFGPWDLAVLILATGQEKQLPGTAKMTTRPPGSTTTDSPCAPLCSNLWG
jgi:hypothetical protein